MIITHNVLVHVSDALESIINGGARQVIKCLAPNEVLKVTRRTYKYARRRKTDPVELVLTLGRPNYDERELIKRAKKAGQMFPLRTVLKFDAKKKKAA